MSAPTVSAAPLTLDGALTIYEVAELKARLIEHLIGSEAPVFDLSGVNEADTAGLQLLLWLRREGERLGKPVTLAVGDAVIELAGFLGVADAFSEVTP